MTQVFHSGFRHPSPKRKRWLHQLLARLPEIERVVLHMHLQERPQREIAEALSMSQPAVSFRLKAAKRRLVLLAKLPEPPITFDEARTLFAPRDAEILVRLQSARSAQVETDMGYRWHGVALERARVMRAQLPPTADRARMLLDLVCGKSGSPFSRVDRRIPYQVPSSDGASPTGHAPPDY